MVICIISIIVFLFILFGSITYLAIDYYINDNVDLDEIYKEPDDEENYKEEY